MTNKIWYFLFAALILTTSCGSDDDEVFVGNWTIHGSFKGIARHGASSFVIGDYAYVTCGQTDAQKDKFKKDLYLYDVASNSWTLRASLPEEAHPRAFAASFTATENGVEKGYITTGRIIDINVMEEDEYLTDTWAYTPSTNTWERKADFGVGPNTPEGAISRQSAIGVSLNGKGYVGTGENRELAGSLNDFFEYNPNEDEWYSKADVSGAKRTGAVAWVMNNTIYVALGVNNTAYHTDLRAYNPTTNTWTEKAKLYNALSDQDFDDKYSMQRAYGVAFVLNNLAYISLGTTGSPRSDTWEYEPVSDRWVQKTSFEIGGGRFHAVAFVVKNRAFITTGKSGASFDDVWEFKPHEEVNSNDNQS